MIRSMTGFGAGEGAVGSARVAVELRSVNHRFFSPSLKLPAAFSRWEGELRELLRRRISRGHVTLVVRIDREATAGTVVREERFAAYVQELRALQDRYGLTEPLDIATVLRLPAVIASDGLGGDETDGTVEEMAAVVQGALSELMAMRETEGARLAALLEDRLASVEEHLARIQERAPERLTAERERLSRSVQELAGGVAVDESRLAQEIAIMADRLDVSEELDRFRSHVVEFRGALRRTSGEPVGKRLSFLLQEMLREANTTGSKARDSAMLHAVVATKEELERIAEQVENIE
jgi:uncharacterized protein (TIGR00255 family)